MRLKTNRKDMGACEPAPSNYPPQTHTDTMTDKRRGRQYQLRPKLKLPNLFENLVLMDPEPVTDAMDAEPGAFPGKFAFEIGGECDKWDSLSGRDATPLNPCLTKCARCL